MAPGLTSITDDVRIAIGGITDRTTSLLNPVLRLGVTGLSRAGKTVFITSLIHNLLHSGRMPLFEAMQSGRVSRARLEEQPDDSVARFQYEDHIHALIQDRVWPESTRAISELRLTLDYESASGWGRLLSRGRLSIDIVDYPGEWLLDLPLLSKDYRTFCKDTFDLAENGTRHELSQGWLAATRSVKITSEGSDVVARALALAFAQYLQACKSDERSLYTLPPGRFLLPGDLDGSPALTFAPLPLPPQGQAPAGSIWAMMERRYEAYKSVVVKPFFRDHFARLDRQIVLIDALQALNRGPEALQDLERALMEVMACFRPGRNSFLSSLLRRRIDKVLVASTKADHLHHESHDRLEALTRRLVERALARIGNAGAGVEVLAIASVRATREATVLQGDQQLPVIVGTPLAGEAIGKEIFDGTRSTAIFPGDLPHNPAELLRLRDDGDGASPTINIVRFRPPQLEANLHVSIPHIRLDRALQFLLGDRLA